VSAIRLHQLGGAVLATIFVDLGYRAWIAGSPHDRPLVLLSIAAYVLAFVAVRGIFATSGVWLTAVYPALCVAGLLVGIATLGLSTDIFGHYANDALAYDQYSAQVLLHGTNPYTTDMRPALDQFRVPAQDRTVTSTGSLVTVQSYPALAFLVYVPLIVAHVRNLLWFNVAMLLVAVLVAYAYVPPESRIAVGLLVIVVQEFLYFVMGGGTDIMWVLPMIGVAALWESSFAWAALWLGIACALKQDAWFVVPFALVHWWRAPGMQPQQYARVVSILIATFLIPNLAFIVWNPAAWAHGVFAPLAAHPLPLGVGFVQLLASHILPPARAFVVLPWILAFGACVYAYVRYPKRCAWMPFVAPAIVLFFAPRSLVSYFLYWPMIAVVYALRWEMP
jgi:uncharacterized membrane protein